MLLMVVLCFFKQMINETKNENSVGRWGGEKEMRRDEKISWEEQRI